MYVQLFEVSREGSTTSDTSDVSDSDRSQSLHQNTGDAQNASGENAPPGYNPVSSGHNVLFAQVYKKVSNEFFKFNQRAQA